MESLTSTFEVLRDALHSSGHSVLLLEDRGAVLIRTRAGEKVIRVTEEEAAPLLPLELVALVRARLAAEPSS